MCITSAPAELSKTKILSIPFDDKQHLIAYANTVVSHSLKPNSMILPIPGTLTKQDFFDTTPYSSFLNELEEALRPRARGISKSKSLNDDELGVENFRLGMYNVFISKNINLIYDSIQTLPEKDRPEINKELINWFAESYGDGWNYVVCVFDNHKPMDAQPIMFKYTPKVYDMLFFPSVDSHTGGAPNLEEQVSVDHFLFTEVNSYEPYTFKKSVPGFLQGRKLVGLPQGGSRINGDWFHPCNHSKIDLLRIQPIKDTLKNHITKGVENAKKS